MIFIISSRDWRTEDFFGRENVKEFAGFKKVAERKLVMLDGATNLEDVAVIPGNRRRSCQEIGQGNIVFGLRTSGGFVLYGDIQFLTLQKRAKVTSK